MYSIYTFIIHAKRKRTAFQAKDKYHMRFLRRFLIIFPCLLLLVGLGVGIPGLLPATPNKIPDEPGSPFIGIYVIGNGAHTDFVLPARDAHGQDWTALFPLPEGLDDKPEDLFVVIGWGQREFYMNTPTWNDLRFGTALRAALGAEPALRVNYVRGTLRPSSSLRFVSLSPAQYARLAEHILASTRRDTEGRAIRIDHPGYTPTDAFYESLGTFSLLRTCNTWAAEGLRAAGQPSPLWTPLEFFVLWHLER